MSSSPYVLQARMNNAAQILQKIDGDYSSGALDIEDTVALYMNVLSLYRGIYEDSKSVDIQLAASALGMCGLLTTRIGQVYQELDLDFDGSFPYLVEGYRILNDALGLAKSGLRGWLYKQINWCLGLLRPIRYDDCDPENPDTWQFRYPESDYLAQNWFGIFNACF